MQRTRCRFGSRRLWGLSLAVLALTLVASCMHTQKPAGKLDIQDHAVGSWIAINNTFSTVAAPSSPPPGWNHWMGILVQIADFAGSITAFDRVTFFKGGDEVRAPLNRLDFADRMFWINIVSKEPDSNHVAPMRPEDVLRLTGKLHGGMLSTNGVNGLIGIITYWQGAKGYELQAVQRNGFDRDGGFEFGLKDDFKVEIYTIDASGTVSLVQSFGPGAIDTITVTSNGPPGDGKKQDPPYPG